MTDLDRLLYQASARDPQTVETLVSEYYSYILRLCRSILDDPDEAEDAAQETLIRAVQNLHRYQPGTSLKNWLSTIAVNFCRDLLRRRKARLALQSTLQGILRLSHLEPSPEEAAMQDEHSRQLWQAVRSLDEKHRLPILLRFVHDLPVREIAEILEINEGTVHSRLHYGVKKLHDQLGSLKGISWNENNSWEGGAR